jgi:hypothetical protein
LMPLRNGPILPAQCRIDSKVKEQTNTIRYTLNAIR